MSDLNRSRLIELLNQLGDEKDETALAAARETSRIVRDAGESWASLLVAEAVEADSAPAAETAPLDRSDDLRIVERLLARKDISDTLRGDLNDFKRSIVEGKLDRMDADYIRALAKRLG